MSQYLPTGGFRWLDLDKLPDILSISPTAKRERRIVKCNELSPYQNNDLIDKLSGGKFTETEKLAATLETKDRYIIHYQNLQQCLELGMELKHVYRVLEFDQTPWLEPYITDTTLRCQKCFRKRFMEINEQCCTWKNYGGCLTSLTSRFSTTNRRGAPTSQNVSRSGTKTEDVYADMIEDADLYDFSDYPEEHPLLEKLPADQWVILPDRIWELKNKKVIRKWKDEFAGTQALRYAENRSKSYALETEDEYKNVQKAKGLKKSLLKKELTIDIYERCILDSVEDKPRTANFLRCERFVPYIICQTKRSINPLDSKIWILNDQVTTWAIRDCQIPAYLSALEKYGNNIPQEILMDLGL
ncbi:hypothetical protein RclHR1_00720009 [Rhizophagus clarus]|nr:hypothetical protein RclHR1_00720009 [Rhizophagus clarus]